MADLLLLQCAQILAVHSNESKNGKIYRSAFLFVPGEEEGHMKPQVVELSFEQEDHEGFAEVKKRVGQSDHIMAEKITWKDGERISFYSFLGDLSSVKSMARQQPVKAAS